MKRFNGSGVRVALVVVASFAASLVAGAGGASAQGYPAVPLISGSQTIIGEPIAYPTTGKALVTSMIVTLAPGEKTMEHGHGVPLFGYILEGEVTIDYGVHGVRTFKQGQGFLEAMQPHVARNTGAGPVRILAVYMGAEGSRDVIAK
jgi:quercetin dioxygenase-like cupin family protein